MIANAVLILVLGMGGVFLFLFVLVLVMTLISRCLPPTAKELNVPSAKKVNAPVVAGGVDESIIAVLQAAVETYEKDIQSPKA